MANVGDRSGWEARSADLNLLGAFFDRLVYPLALVSIVFAIGTVGFLWIGGGRWSVLDCAYFTSITMTTVGYGELEAMGPGARLFAMGVMWTGMGVALYGFSTVTAFLLEKNLTQFLTERKMQKILESLENHYVVCGAGRMGMHVINELAATRRDCVVIEQDDDRIQWLRERHPDLPYICGNATEEETLMQARIGQAKGLIVALRNDGDNLLVTVQARFVKPDLVIATRCNEANLEKKFLRAGANHVINPQFIGGLRMVSEVVRPHVVGFFDYMLRGDEAIRVEEAVVSGTSGVCGMTLAEADLPGRTGLVAVALRPAGSDVYRFNPGCHEKLEEGAVIIVIGGPEQLVKLRDICKSSA